MLDFTGTSLSNLPLEGLSKVHDLLYGDGPILSHYKDERGLDYLFYWVDFDEQANRWLVWKVETQQLYDYLSGGVTLRHIIEASSNPYFFLVDKNENGDDVRVMMLNSFRLPQDYLPDDRSLFTTGLPTPYSDYLHEYNYINKLRERGYTFTLEPKNKVHGTTVSAREGGVFLINITKSIDSYIDATATEVLKPKIGDRARLNRQVNQIKQRVTPRIADVAFHSFQVVIAIDTIVLTSEEAEVTQWREQVVQSYENDVLNIDFGNEDAAESIIAKIPDPESRKKIFEPLFRILENSDISVQVFNHNKQFNRSFRNTRVAEGFKKKLLPEESIEAILAAHEKRNQIVTAVFKLPEGGAISDFRKKELLDNLLFTQEGGHSTFPIPSPIELGDVTLHLAHSLECTVMIESSGQIALFNVPLNLHAQGENMQEVITDIRSQFVSLVMYYNERPELVDEKTAELGRLMPDWRRVRRIDQINTP